MPTIAIGSHVADRNNSGFERAGTGALPGGTGTEQQPAGGNQ